MKTQKSISVFSNVKFVLSYLYKIDKKLIFFNLILIPVNVLIPTLQMFVPKLLVDETSLRTSINRITIIIFTITAILMFLEFARHKLSCYSDIKLEKVAKQFDLKFSEKMMNLSLESLESEQGQIGYQKAKNSLSEYGVYGFIDCLVGLLINIFGFLTYVAIIIRLNWVIVPILLASEILCGVVALIVQKFEQKIKPNRAETDRKINYINNVSKDYIAAKDIRIYKMSNYLSNLGKTLIRNKKFWNKKQYKYFFVENCLSALISVLIMAGTYGYLLYALMQSELNIGDMVLYLGAILGFSSWLSGIVSMVDQFNRTNQAVKDMRIFLNIEDNTNINQSDSIKNISNQYILELNNVEYIYPGNIEKTIKNINLKIKEKEKIAIVGLNGAGKTTLIKLILGLYQPTNGSVFCNGISVLSPEVKKFFSAVFQDIKWLPISILENISMYPLSESNEKRAWHVLELSGISEAIKKLPKGIFTPLTINMNSDAIQFSGGEYQKLAMARALYKEASILILDEPTASLDPIAENEIYSKYNEICSNKTSIFISHRLASTKFCDRIIFLDKGEIVEEGSHDELMQKNGKYANLFRLQSKYYTEEVDW